MAATAQPVEPTPADKKAPPDHVAIIMDGNGRWASARHLPRIAGHREGARAVRRTIEAAIQNGVGWLTLYAFSSENWRRPRTEVLDLTGLLRQYLRSEIAELKANGVRVRIIGDPERFDPDIQRDLAAAERDTAHNDRLNLTVALSYGAGFARFLATADMPDPDLVIRTSGEQRLSNFLLWQAAYAEFVFMDVLWPDFGEAHFAAALREYAGRERRFGARPG